MRTDGDIYQFNIDMVMEYVTQRIECLTRQISENRLSGEFSNVASFCPNTDGGGFSMIGSFAFDMFIWDALAGMADTALIQGGMLDSEVFSTTFNTVAVAGMEAYSMLKDENVYALRSGNVRAYYPKGRKKTAIDPKLGRNFNRAVNQNGMPGKSEAELAVMMDVVKKLESLLAAKVREITVSDGESVYEAISGLYKKARKHGGMDMLFGGLRTAI